MRKKVDYQLVFFNIAYACTLLTTVLSVFLAVNFSVMGPKIILKNG